MKLKVIIAFVTLFFGVSLSSDAQSRKYKKPYHKAKYKKVYHRPPQRVYHRPPAPRAVVVALPTPPRPPRPAVVRPPRPVILVPPAPPAPPRPRIRRF